MKPVSRGIDRVAVTFDEPNLVANAGLVLIATVAKRLGLERLCDTTIELSGRVGGFRQGRKILTLVHAMVAGASHTSTTPTAARRSDRRGARAPGDGTLDARDLLALVHLRPRPQFERVIGEALGPPGRSGRDRATHASSSTSTRPSTRSTARRNTALPMATPKSSATTRSWPPWPPPERFSMPACTRVRQHPARHQALRRRACGVSAPGRRDRTDRHAL